MNIYFIIILNNANGKLSAFSRYFWDKL